MNSSPDRSPHEEFILGVGWNDGSVRISPVLAGVSELTVTSSKMALMSTPSEMKLDKTSREVGTVSQFPVADETTLGDGNGQCPPTAADVVAAVVVVVGGGGGGGSEEEEEEEEDQRRRRIRKRVTAMALTGWQTVNTRSARLDAGAGHTAPTTVAPAAHRHSRHRHASGRHGNNTRWIEFIYTHSHEKMACGWAAWK